MSFLAPNNLIYFVGYNATVTVLSSFLTKGTSFQSDQAKGSGVVVELSTCLSLVLNCKNLAVLLGSLRGDISINLNSNIIFS